MKKIYERIDSNLLFLKEIKYKKNFDINYEKEILRTKLETIKKMINENEFSNTDNIIKYINNIEVDIRSLINKIEKMCQNDE